MRTSRDDITSLVEYCDSDLRQSLTMLQFWAESGGSCQPIIKPYDKKSPAKANGLTENTGKYIQNGVLSSSFELCT